MTHLDNTKPTAPGPYTFPGFSTPNGTIIPDEVFDILLPVLSEAELKVLLYIARRTFGFKKDADNISLQQLQHGIITRDGRVLDNGTGLSKSAIIKGTKGLVERGIVVVSKGLSPHGDNDINLYTLRFKPGVVVQDYHGGSNSVPPGGSNLLPTTNRVNNKQNTKRYTAKSVNQKSYDADAYTSGKYGGNVRHD